MDHDATPGVQKQLTLAHYKNGLLGENFKWYAPVLRIALEKYSEMS